MKSRMWIAAAALAAAVVFLVMVTGERAPAQPSPVPAPVSSSEAVLASDGDPPDDTPPEDATADADREEVVDALKGLLDALGISAEELAGCGAESDDSAGNGSGNGGGNGGGKDDGARDGGCEQPGAAATEPAAQATITIAGFAFGQPLTVAPGATVEVVNTDSAPHNVTAADGSFETPDLNQDDTATFTAPTAPGRYQFTCTLHPEMTGTLIVAGGANSNSGSNSSGNGGAGRNGGDADGAQRGGDHGERPQHSTTAPGRGTSDGY